MQRLFPLGALAPGPRVSAVAPASSGTIFPSWKSSYRPTVLRLPLRTCSPTRVMRSSHFFGIKVTNVSVFPTLSVVFKRAIACWTCRQRRILIRWEYHAHNFLGFVQLACLVILL